MTQDKDQMRAEFENWCCQEYGHYGKPSMVRCPDGYAHAVSHSVRGSCFANIEMLWEAWQAATRSISPLIARPLVEWHEDDGHVVWWAWCGHEWAGEPAWIGTPLCDDWPGYHTHWTPHTRMPMNAVRAALKENSNG